MSYLKDYLKVIPKADSDRVKENIAENQELFEVENFSEEAFERLINQLVEESEIQAKLSPLSPQIKADELNTFYRDVALDLSRLFPEQNHIEQAGENYERIYHGHLEEIKQGINSLKRTIDQLEDTSRGEKGLILKSYSFEPENKLQHSEELTEDTAYLFVDRNGESRPTAETNRLFHTHYLSLSKEKEVDALVNESGHITAKLDVVYESPYTLSSTNEAYSLQHALDGDASTFWMNVALKPDNRLDGVDTSPRGGR